MDKLFDKTIDEALQKRNENDKDEEMAEDDDMAGKPLSGMELDCDDFCSAI